jgi:hypothetical protein
MFFLTIFFLLFNFQFSSSHFIINAPKDVSTSDLENITSYLESKYSELENNWGLKRDSKINIIIFPSVYDYIKTTHSSKEIGGLYYNGKIYLQPISVLSRRRILNSILSHELAHAFLDGYLKSGLPIWLNESFAICFADEISRFKKSGNLKLNHLSDLDRLLKVENKKKSDVYFYLGLTMQFFIKTYSQEKVALLLKSFKGDNPNKVIASVFNEPMEQIERKWRECLGKFR